MSHMLHRSFILADFSTCLISTRQANAVQIATFALVTVRTSYNESTYGVLDLPSATLSLNHLESKSLAEIWKSASKSRT